MAITHQDQMRCLRHLYWIDMSIENHFKNYNSKQNENYKERERNHPTRSS